MSGDPEQEYFVDGLVEDVITALSRFRSLFVIARNSSFSYKGKSPDIRQVGRELGVRYVVEGSVRRAANRIRVTAQLVDSLSGNHIWAEQYDRMLEDIFAVQEEVTRDVVAAIAPQVDIAEVARSFRMRPENLGAYELALSAWADSRDAWVKFDADLRQRAIGKARQALAIDQRSGLAAIVIGHAQWQHISAGTGSDLAAAAAEGVSATSRAIDVDPSNHLAFMVRGMLQYQAGRRRIGIDDVRRAHQLNMNCTLTLFCLSSLESLFGDAAKGIEYARTALRLSPRDYWRAPMQDVLSTAYFLGREYRLGMEAALAATREAPGYLTAYLNLARNLVGLNEPERATAMIEIVRRKSPEFLSHRLAMRGGADRQQDAERLRIFLRIAAGLEDPSAADALR